MRFGLMVAPLIKALFSQAENLPVVASIVQRTTLPFTDDTMYAVELLIAMPVGPTPTFVGTPSMSTVGVKSYAEALASPQLETAPVVASTVQIETELLLWSELAT